MNYNKFFSGIIVIPLSMQGNWKIESYSSIPSNKVIFSNRGISVKVNKSASPMIYSFSKSITLKSFHIEGEFLGLPKFLDLTNQGNAGFDDYPLRIGFVLSGNKKLSFLQRTFAPKWIKNLYADLPADIGLDYIQFYNVTQNKVQLGLSRVHPLSDVLHEKFFALIEKNGKFSYDINFEAPKDVSGLWISIDGDDTQSEFEVNINKLDLF